MQIKRYVCPAVITALFLAGCSSTPQSSASADEASADAAVTTDSGLEETMSVSKVTVFLTGDGLIHESVYMDAMNDDGTFDFGKQLDLITAVAEPYDLQYYNQETILGGTELGLSGYPTFNSPQEYGEYMVSKGFNLVSTANNHCLDRGWDGIVSSHDFWASQEGVLMDGTNVSEEEQAEIRHTEINGISFAFLSYCENTNGIYEDYDFEVNDFPAHEEEMLAKVAEADSLYDVVVVAMHWGTEYSHDVNEYQTYLADRLTASGADIIVGNHPHVIQPFQWVNGKPVFYAMGNLISTQLDTDNLIGMMAGLDITKTTDNGISQITIDNVRADLHYTYMEGEYPDLRYNVKVYPFSQLSEDILPDYESWYSEYTGIITALDSNIQIGGV